MNYNNKALQLFQKQDLDESEKTLVLGFEESLVKSLPAGSTFIDPSISNTKVAACTFPDKIFTTENLASFTLDTKFHSILSLNKLHLVKDLSSAFACIEKHLLEDAHLYFPLACNKQIKEFLTEKLELEDPFEKPAFIQRTRSDIEDAVMQAPFETIHIEEKIEHMNFYSKESLQSYLKNTLPQLITLPDQKTQTLIEELSTFLYKDQSTDDVLSLSSPWILLSLSNNDEYVEFK